MGIFTWVWIWTWAWERGMDVDIDVDMDMGMDVDMDVDIGMGMDMVDGLKQGMKQRLKHGHGRGYGQEYILTQRLKIGHGHVHTVFTLKDTCFLVWGLFFSTQLIKKVGIIVKNSSYSRDEVHVLIDLSVIFIKFII